MVWLILIPAAFALARLFTKRHIFSSLTTLSCAALVFLWHGNAWAGAGLILSAIADTFMRYRNGREEVYRVAIIGFLLAHLCFAVCSLCMAKFSVQMLLVGIALLVGYLLYMKLRLFERIEKLLRIPALCYLLVSLFSFTCAMMTGNAWYAVGIGLLLFSDTMLAEHDFAKTKWAELFVLPTYYACHMALALSMLL